MHRTPAVALLAVLAVVAALAGAGPAAAAKPKPKPKPPTVPAVLTSLRDSGAIDEPHRAQWTAVWTTATSTWRGLRGVRRSELGAVRRTLATLAARKGLTATRAPLAFLTLERNRDWWASQPVIANHARVSFAGSELVWQRYAGQGLQVQWLGTFGAANGLAGRRSNEPRLRLLLDEALALATQRAGGIAFESLFAFDGGAPGWVSGLSQATAAQALARASQVLGEARYAQASHLALGIFRTPPPAGVAVAGLAGTHYLQYSFAPGLHVVNGFVQALNGLHDAALVTGDPDARALFLAGEPQLRAELPSFNTGAWSLYSIPGGESDLHYHLVLRDFLAGLCRRLTADAQDGLGLPDATPYCATADAFTANLATPPVVTVVSAQARTRKPTTLRYATSKVATVRVTLTRTGKVVLDRTARLRRGSQTLRLTPQKQGPLDVAVRAVDLAGNVASATGTLDVLPPKAKAK